MCLYMLLFLFSCVYCGLLVLINIVCVLFVVWCFFLCVSMCGAVCLDVVCFVSCVIIIVVVCVFIVVCIVFVFLLCILLYCAVCGLFITVNFLAGQFTLFVVVSVLGLLFVLI